VAFRCPRSRQRFEAAIVSPGAAEIPAVIDDTTEVVCHFCNQTCHYTRGDMAAVLAAAR